tara:strand:+ start:253 stop:606 length:354 start_codon:yes stop_codon:yes gene_type:complete
MPTAFRDPESGKAGEMRQLMRYRTTMLRGRGRFVLTQALVHSKDRVSALSGLAELSASEPSGETMNAFRLEAVLVGGPLMQEDLSAEQVASLSGDPNARGRLYDEGMLSHQLFSGLA